MHDYRYDPFNDVAEPFAITGETHIIPTNSPYTIRLNEVPVKESPSTVSLTIGGVAGVEVAADPAAGEFRCDYTTGADQDDNWNTGLIQFNAADAGKTVVVNYNGIGTLASVNAPLTLPSWAKYCGDGSDGDFVAVGGETLSGIKQYNSFIIGAGLTVNVGADPLVIFCKGAVRIDGTLNGKGGNGGTNTSSNTDAGGISVGGGGNGGSSTMSENLPAFHGSGGGAGGKGCDSGSAINGASSLLLNNYNVGTVADNYGSESVQYFTVAVPFAVAVSPNSPSAYYQNLLAFQFMAKAGAGGAGGYTNGAGGGGGGTIVLAGENVTKNGTLNVNGGLKTQTYTGSNNNIRCGGGGGGASIIIVAKNIIINGTVDVSGGNGGIAKSRDSVATNGGLGWYKIFTAG